MSYDECRAKTSSSRFLKWIRYFKQREREKWSEASPEHYYLAQIALEVRRVLAKDPRKHKLNHMMLEFDVEQEEAQEPEWSGDQSKNFWLAALGIK